MPPSANLEEGPAQAPERVPWQCAATAGFIIAILTLGLLITGLATRTALEAKWTQSAQLVIFTLNFEHEVKVSYFDASYEVSVNGNAVKSNFTMDDLTCGKTTSVKFGAAVHFVAVAACVPMIVAFWLDRKPGTMKSCLTHAPVITESIVIVILLFLHMALGDVRAGANYEKCDKIPVGLERYAVGPCWLLAILAEVMLVTFFIVHVCVRYGKCCCYETEPATQTTRGMTPMQAIQPAAHAHTSAYVVQGQVIPPPNQQQVYGYPAVYDPEGQPPQPGRTQQQSGYAAPHGYSAQEIQSQPC